MQADNGAKDCCRKVSMRKFVVSSMPLGRVSHVEWLALSLWPRFAFAIRWGIIEIVLQWSELEDRLTCGGHSFGMKRPNFITVFLPSYPYKKNSCNYRSKLRKPCKSCTHPHWMSIILNANALVDAGDSKWHQNSSWLITSQPQCQSFRHSSQGTLSDQSDLSPVHCFFAMLVPRIHDEHAVPPRVRKWADLHSFKRHPSSFQWEKEERFSVGGM